MSYILDALKRADADRARGAVPGLHTPQSPLSATRLAPARSAVALPWLLGTTALALVGGAGWWWGASGRAETPARVATDRPAAQAPVPAVAASAAVEQLPPAGPAPAQTVAVSAEPPPGPAALPTVSPTATRAAAAVAPAPTESDRGRGSTAAAAPRVPTLAELSPTVRQQLPALTISGHTQSRDPAMRMLIVQSQVYREGDRLGPDWTLEQIGPKAAVLNFRGQRYQVPL